jgi:hypothetical protein
MSTQSVRKTVPASTVFTITHVVTEDSRDGQPWPPEGEALWCVVARSHGTRWRHIALQTEQPKQPADRDARRPAVI